MLTILGILFGLAGFVCGIIILIDAFKSEWWKGLLCLVTCGLYMLYYAFVEFKHEKKWLIVAIWLLGGSIGAGLRTMGAQG